MIADGVCVWNFEKLESSEHPTGVFNQSEFQYKSTHKNVSEDSGKIRGETKEQTENLTVVRETNDGFKNLKDTERKDLEFQKRVEI
jgi:hypothetical protein